MSVTGARGGHQNETHVSPQWGLCGTMVPGTSEFPHLAFALWPRTPDRHHMPASGASSIHRHGVYTRAEPALRAVLNPAGS